MNVYHQWLFSCIVIHNIKRRKCQQYALKQDLVFNGFGLGEEVTPLVNDCCTRTEHNGRSVGTANYLLTWAGLQVFWDTLFAHNSCCWRAHCTFPNKKIYHGLHTPEITNDVYVIKRIAPVKVIKGSTRWLRKDLMSTVKRKSSLIKLHALITAVFVLNARVCLVGIFYSLCHSGRVNWQDLASIFRHTFGSL